jgi:Family of unknown function (DUF5996)
MRQQFGVKVDPRTMMLELLQGTYEAAATQGRWDRENLERG